VWSALRLPVDSFEALHVRLRGKPDTAFGVFTKVESSLHGAMYDVYRNRRQIFLFLLGLLTRPSVFIYIQTGASALTCSVD